MKNSFSHRKISNYYGKNYFKTNGYENLDFKKKYTMYWWSCRFYARLINRFCKEGRVLDIGCGLGHLLKRLEDGYLTYGVDVNQWAVDQAKKLCQKSVIKNSVAEEIDSFNPDFFNLIIMRHLLEHLIDPVLVIKKAKKVLKKGGFLIIATPNPLNLLAGFQKGKWVGFLDPSHISINTPSFWIKTLEQNGFLVKLKISDGFWAAPYLPVIPASWQKPIFGFLGGLQVVSGITFLPPFLGESLILVAQKDPLSMVKNKK